jgi:hypothetical protein
MQFVSVSGRAEGFIAIGQEATGVIAIGQQATGVIAIGQIACGCFCLGQAAVGFVGWGQAGVGIFHAVGMVGVGGRGFGLVIRLVPGVGRKRVVPEVIDVGSALHGSRGWVEVDLFFDGHGLGLASQGQRLPVKFDRRLQGGAKTLTVHGPQTVWAYLAPQAGVVVCERIQHAPPRPFERPSFFVRAALQFAALVALATLWWMFIGPDMARIFQQFMA